MLTGRAAQPARAITTAGPNTSPSSSVTSPTATPTRTPRPGTLCSRRRATACWTPTAAVTASAALLEGRQTTVAHRLDQHAVARTDRRGERAEQCPPRIIGPIDAEPAEQLRGTDPSATSTVNVRPRATPDPTPAISENELPEARSAP